MTQIEYAHLVLVEDDQALAELTVEFLSQQGYRLTHIADGAEVVDKISDLNPDCVILDIMLPGIDGIEVCRRLRNSYQGPIIFLTARNEQIDEILGLEVGGDDFLSKPVEPRVLLAHIRAHLRRQQKMVNQHAVVDTAKIELNTIKHTASYKGKELTINLAEFQLLQLLLEQGGIVSRDDIMLTIRGIEHDGISRTVDILVSELRKKIPDPEWIKTVRGKGYIWNGCH